jgi:hypothetical protein
MTFAKIADCKQVESMGGLSRFSCPYHLAYDPLGVTYSPRNGAETQRQSMEKNEKTPTKLSV